MKILVTNDDGITSEGIRLLAIELENHGHEVFVIAPDTERSACAHSITLRESLNLKKYQLEGFKGESYSLSGTPADCVRVGLEVLYKDQIDIVFSGINRGYNSGADVVYSGTVSACAEANIYNKPGVAVSTEFKDGSSDFELPSKFAPVLFEKYKDLVLEEKMVLNINVPKLKEEEVKGIAICELGDMVYDSFKVEEVDDDHKIIHLDDRYYKGYRQESDQEFLSNGYITITPIEYIFGTPELISKFKDIK